jgi:hypothetical protein
MICITPLRGAGCAGGRDADSAWNQKKLEARKMLASGDEFPPSIEHFVRRILF